MITRISLDLRGLQLAEHGLFVTVCRHRLPVPGDVADPGRCGRRGGIPARAVPREGLAGGPCPAASAGIAVTEGRYAR
jgi:hypothetical protein